MSLVVYDGTALYADRFIMVRELGSDVFSIATETKLVHSEFIAIAILGVSPHKANRDEALKLVASNVYLYETHNEFVFFDGNNPKAHQIMFQSTNTTYFVLTHAGLYKFVHDGFHVMDDRIEVAQGSGSIAYTIARQSGLSVEESYYAAAFVERTAGPIGNFCKRSELKDIKTHFEEHERKKREQHDPAQGQ